MRLEILDDKILIWETGRQANDIEFDSTKDLSEYDRRELSHYELFLRSENQFEIADKINLYLGKIIRIKDLKGFLIPDGNYRVNHHLNYLKDTIDKYVKEYGLNLNPDFQRTHVWNMEQRILYVEFMIKGGKSNPIYLNCVNWQGLGALGEFVVVDGKQRLTSLLMFLNNEFTILKELDKDGIGYYAKEFDMIPNDVEFIINELPNRESVLKWYLQMNEGNVAHTKEELDKVKNMIDKIKED